jgi:hypothetical protein
MTDAEIERKNNQKYLASLFRELEKRLIRYHKKGYSPKEINRRLFHLRVKIIETSVAIEEARGS